MNKIPADPGKRGVVAVIVRDERFLVIRRSQHVVAPGRLCFPGGAIEPGESQRDALVRELQEELGVIVRPKRAIWQSVTAWQVEINWWQAELGSEASLLPNPDEVESVHWMRAGDLAAHGDLLESNHEFLSALAAGMTAIVPE